MKRYMGPRKVLKIYIDNEDTYKSNPLWEEILKSAKKSGIAGATVYKAAAGMGAHSTIQTFNVWSMSQKLPVVIEMIDKEDKIMSFLRSIEHMIEEGLVTLSDVDVIMYKHPKL
ncbi:DUF190 domain-containing protein [Nitrosophilus alvini]|uniref:DUF190 domain-containing protein n=1 Tax=Nitrosophilus alvini TaxID=2714855 RepID=UPI00190E487B|nr:DUF190 domain-containing protein [Nitrosophilus alvini]